MTMMILCFSDKAPHYQDLPQMEGESQFAEVGVYSRFFIKN